MRILLSLFVGLYLALSFTNSLAQSVDADFKSLMKDRKFAEAEALARDRIGKNPRDDVALWYLSRSIAGDPKKRDEAIARGEQCVKELPQSARCHNALGMLYGAAALSGGMGSIIKYASSIKEEFAKAVELDPRFFDARRDLNQFYLQAPGIAGGSVRKAIENSDAMARLNANQGALLRAEVHIYEKEFDKAESLLNSIKPGNDVLVADTLPLVWAGLGYSLLNDKEHSRALKLFERLVAFDMNSATMLLGLGRAQLENKLVDAAITSFERALKINEKVGAQYRLGIAWQTKGDKQKAMNWFQQFLSYQATGRAADDARSRIEELKRG
jgi:tetratricopeptide (TPR) repeat protein